MSTGDVRAAVARAARALGRAETSSAALRLPDSPALAPIAEAIGACLRLRGVDVKDPEAGPPSPNEILLRTRQALEKTDTTAAAAPFVAQLAGSPRAGRRRDVARRRARRDTGGQPLGVGSMAAANS